MLIYLVTVFPLISAVTADFNLVIVKLCSDFAIEDGDFDVCWKK